jgi:hypothetical protein
MLLRAMPRRGSRRSRLFIVRLFRCRPRRHACLKVPTDRRQRLAFVARVRR